MSDNHLLKDVKLNRKKKISNKKLYFMYIFSLARDLIVIIRTKYKYHTIPYYIICHGFQKAKCQKKSSKKGEKNEKKTGIRFYVSRNGHEC